MSTPNEHTGTEQKQRAIADELLEMIHDEFEKARLEFESRDIAASQFDNGFKAGKQAGLLSLSNRVDRWVREQSRGGNAKLSDGQIKP